MERTQPHPVTQLELLRRLPHHLAGRSLLASAVLLLLFLLSLLPGPAPLRLQQAMSGWLILAMGIVTSALALRTARNPAVTPPIRLAWGILTPFMLLHALCALLWARMDNPPDTLLTAGWALSYLGFVAALVAVPSVLREPGKRLDFWLDVLIVAVCAGMAVWYLVLGPLAEANEHLSVLDLALSLGFPILDLLILIAAGVVLLQPYPWQVRMAITWVITGVFFKCIGNVGSGYSSLVGLSRMGGWAEACLAIDYLLIAWGTYLNHEAAGPAKTVGPWRWRQWAYAQLPYLALLAASLLVLLALRDHWGGSLGVLLWGSALLTVLAMLRQVRTVAENVRLVQSAVAERIESRFRALVQNSSDVIAIVSPAGTFTYVSPSAERLLAVSGESLVGTSLTSLVHPEEQEGVGRFLQGILESQAESRSVTCRVSGSGEQWRFVEVLCSNRVSHPDVQGIVLNARDLTERITLEEALSHQAQHDPLTGLANRSLFQQRLRQHLRASPPHAFGVLFLDLDDFKSVNDTLGHEQGDVLLKTVAARLLSATRGSDTVARLGGDEFAILLAGTRVEAEATVVAERILNGLRTPIPLEGREARVGSSIGIVLSQGLESVEDVLRNADVAMYHAKRSGKGSYAFYQESMREAVLQRLEMEEDLRRALEEGGREFSLSYQPMMSLQGGAPRVRSLEALVRWHHPERGLIAPLDFIPRAEETGQIKELGAWVLRAACTEARGWQEALGEGAPPVSVNISGRQLAEPGFAGEVSRILEETGLSGSQLILEVTESVLMEDAEAAIQTLEHLKGLGLKIAIDDFGTGYSSLNYLQRFPVDILKVDKSFVTGVAHGEQGSALARTIIALGASLSVETVAEGIETEEQLARLRVLGCDTGQGYYFAHPRKAEAVLSMLEELQSREEGVRVA